jgi:hypothetical protein
MANVQFEQAESGLPLVSLVPSISLVPLLILAAS